MFRLSSRFLVDRSASLPHPAAREALGACARCRRRPLARARRPLALTEPPDACGGRFRG